LFGGLGEDDHRFGFNGKENDKSFGSQIIQDYGFRLYNPALAKFLSVDPLSPEFPFYTPYQFAGNTPIAAIDLDGLEISVAITIGDDVSSRGAKLDKYTKDDVLIYNFPANESVTQNVISALKDASSKEKEGLGFVAIFSHGTVNSGIWGKDMEDGEFIGYYPQGMGSYDEFEELEEAVKLGDIKFAKGAIIYLGGCNQCTKVPGGYSQADEWSNAVNVRGSNVTIVGATEAVAPGRRGERNEDGEFYFQVKFYATGDFLHVYPGGEEVSKGNYIDVAVLANETMETIKERRPLRYKKLRKVYDTTPIQTISRTSVTEQ
jgi:RHS repeat-associated protein